MTVTHGSVLADHLVAAGVETVFALAGAGHTHLLLPLEDRGVRIVGTRHETGAVGAADGYARATGQIGVAAIIAEQGLPNAITPIMTAFQLGSPVVVLVTRFPDSWVEAAGETAIDQHALLLPITKWVRTVPAPYDLGRYFETARRIALSGTPGPVVLVIPQHFLGMPIAKPIAPQPATLPTLPAAHPAAITATLALLATAKRPSLLVDSGCTGPAAQAAVQALSGRFGLPVFGYGSGRGVIAENDAREVLPWPYAQRALPACDLLLVAGARLNMWFGFGRAPRFPDALTVIQIDGDAAAIGRNRPVELGIAADPGLALAQLVSALDAAGSTGWSPHWLTEALAPRRAAVAEAAARMEAPIHAITLVTALEAARPNDGIVVGDGADILNWSNAAFRIARPRGYMDHHPLGSMGIGLPLALGAAAAERDLARREGRPAVPTLLLTGDGSIGFYLAELDTAVRDGLSLKIVIGNDAQWGTEFHGQTLMTGRSVNTRLAATDYAAIARGFGMTAETVEDPAALSDALERLFATDGAALLDVRIDPAAGMALKINPALSFLIFSDLAPPEA